MLKTILYYFWLGSVRIMLLNLKKRDFGSDQVFLERNCRVISGEKHEEQVQKGLFQAKGYFSNRT